MCTGFFVPQPKRCFFCLKWGRMMEEAEKMRGGAEKLLVRNNELLRIYRILLKIGGKLIEFYSRFEYNGE